MSILGPVNEHGPRAKRRKMSNDDRGDSRFEQFPSEAGESNINDQEGPAPAEKSSNGLVRKLQPPKPLTPLPAGGVNKSSILTVQLNDLLATSTPNYDAQISSIEPVLDKIKQRIRNVPKTGSLSLKDAETLVAKSTVSIPFPAPKPSKETNLKFEFDQPSSIGIESGLHLRIGTKRIQQTKIVVETPRHLVQEKDYLNYRGFHKRAFYLACIAAHFKKEAADDFELYYDHEDGVPLVPGLVLASKRKQVDKEKTPQQIFFITVNFPAGVFSLEKTLPTKNCVRPEARSESSELEPTPSYNSTLNIHQTCHHYQDLISATIQQSPAFADACRSGQIWLRQRGFDSDVSSGGFGLLEWATISALLLHAGGHKGHALFSGRYSTLQLFKAMLQVLSGRDMADPWILNASNLSLPQLDSPTLYDGHTGVNILYKMTPWSYQVLRHNARVSLASVNSKREDSFEVTFDILVAQLLLQFDETYSIKLSELGDSALEKPQDTLCKLYRVMKRGLGDRATLIDLQSPPFRSWSISKPNTRLKENALIGLRLILNMDAASRLIDHGPSADDQEAATEFQRFWGAKSELRRFKDGSISESLVWSASRPVTEQIIEHLLGRHFGARSDTLACKSPKLEEHFLDSGSSVTAAEAYKHINNHFQTLSSTLHQLEGLPLSIRSISPADQALRSSTLYHPLLPNTAKPISILIQFDSSTRWPDTLPAVQHTKIAFLLKLSDLLSSSSALTTRVGLENTPSQHSGYLNTSFLDITYPSPQPLHLSPITFRLRIHHDREISLLQTHLNSKSLPSSERIQLQSALVVHKRLLATPLHTTTVRTLATRFPALSPTIRLLQSFFAAHHLSSLLPAELLELIAAQMFLYPAPFSVLGSPTTAFLRTLYFLSRWDWSLMPLIVDLSIIQDMPEETREELKTRFHAWRKLDPTMNNVSWFIGSSIEASGVVWVEGGAVEKVIAGRVRSLAQGVMKVVGSLELEGGRVGGSGWKNVWREVFTGDTKAFDFVLSLRRSVIRRRTSNNSLAVVAINKNEKKDKSRQESKFKNLQLAQQSPISEEEIGFDPIALFLADLRQTFGHVALFFYGDGQDVICGLWRPSVLGGKEGNQGGREWKVRLGWSSVPIRVVKGEDGSVNAGGAEGEGQGGGTSKVLSEFNKEAVLVEIATLGEGIVREVNVSHDT